MLDKYNNLLEEIKTLVAINEVSQSLNKFIDLTRDLNNENLETKAILLSKQYTEINDKETKGFLDPEESSRKKNKVVDDLLSCIRSDIPSVIERESDSLIESKTFEVHQKQLIELRDEIRSNSYSDIIALEAKELEKGFPNSSFHLSMESFNIKLGEIVGIFGENASGKTTLLRILSGQLYADSGYIDYPIVPYFKDDVLWADQKSVTAYVGQELPNWYGTITQNLKYEAAMHGFLGTDNENQFNWIVTRLGLTEHLEKKWKDLSAGYKLRFSLAKALIRRAKLIVLDEPLAFLDVKAQLIVLNDLKDLCKSIRYPMAVVISSQHIEELEYFADRLYVLKDGYCLEFKKDKSDPELLIDKIFEFVSSVSWSQTFKVLDDLNIPKYWNGYSFFIKISRTEGIIDLLSMLKEKGVEVSFIRDISNSVKREFYEEIV